MPLLRTKEPVTEPVIICRLGWRGGGDGGFLGGITRFSREQRRGSSLIDRHLGGTRKKRRKLFEVVGSIYYLFDDLVQTRTKFHVLNSLESLKGIPVIRTFDKRGCTPSLQTTTTEVRNIYMVYQQVISLVSLLPPELLW